MLETIRYFSNYFLFLCMNVGCGPRESKDGGECIYNCSPKDKSFCRVEFVDPNRLLGNLRGLCFKNEACYGTPKACVDCNLKCEGYSGDCSATTSTPASILDKPPIKILFPDKAPIKDLSTGVSVEETHCVRCATSSINSPCLVSTKIT